MPWTQRICATTSQCGLVHAEVKAEATAGGTTFRFGDDSSELKIGAGMLFNLTPSWGVRAEFEKVDDVNFWSIGLQFRF